MLFQYLNQKKIGSCMGLNPGHLTLKEKIESTAPLKYNKMFFPDFYRKNTQIYVIFKLFFACRGVNSMTGAWVKVKLG